eukprot:3214524-Prymnesium_polylepis.2
MSTTRRVSARVAGTRASRALFREDQGGAACLYAPAACATRGRVLVLCCEEGDVPATVPMTTLPDTQDGTVPHRGRPAHIPWAVGEHKGECIMLVCKCEPLPTCHPPVYGEKDVEE